MLGFAMGFSPPKKTRASVSAPRHVKTIDGVFSERVLLASDATFGVVSTSVSLLLPDRPGARRDRWLLQA